MKNKDNKKMFLEGLKKAIDTIEPKSIIIYGFVTENNIEEYFGYATAKGIKLIKIILISMRVQEIGLSILFVIYSLKR